MKIILKTVLSMIILTLGLSSCNNHSSDHEEHSVQQQPILDIHYPAAYVVNGESADLTVVNLSTQKHTETIKLDHASWPHHVYLNQSKTLLAVAVTGNDLSGGHGGHNNGGASMGVHIINALTGQTLKKIILPKMPHNAIFSTDGSELWVGQPDSVISNIFIYNTSDWTLKQSISVGAGLSELTFSYDGTKLYATQTDANLVTVINANTKQIIKTVAVDDAPVGAWPASNGMMYVDNEVGQTISEISVEGDSVVSSFQLGYKPGYAAYSKKYGEVWVSDATNGKVVVYKKNGNAWQRTVDITTGSDAHAIAFSLDGNLAYVTNQGANTISIISTSNKSVVKNIASGLKPNGIVLKEF